MTKFNHKGFAVAHLALILVALALVGGAGWYVWNAQKATNTPLDSGDKVQDVEKTAAPTVIVKDITEDIEGVPVTFIGIKSFGANTKEEIIERIVKPLIYDENILSDNSIYKIEIIEHVSEYGIEYGLGYFYKGDPTEPGFLFGSGNVIKYYQPRICGPHECAEYPEEFKSKFPGNYQAYLDCIKNESDKNQEETEEQKVFQCIG